MDELDKYKSVVANLLLHLDKVIVQNIVDSIKLCSNNGGRIFVAGNGGSATTASHFAGDLAKTCKLKAYSLVDSNYLITGLGNDTGYDYIFSLALKNYAFKKDLLVVISCSGNSPNIIEAVGAAKIYGVSTIGLLGFDGGLVRDNCDTALVVDCACMEQIEDAHLSICHLVVYLLKQSVLGGS